VVQGDYHDQVRALGGNAHIAQAVKADLGGIGYVAVGYLHAESNRGGLTALRIRESKETPAVDPLDRAMVLTGQYPIARPLFQFTNGTPTQVTRDFLQFELSAEGETILDEMGFYPLVDSWRPRNAHLAGGARP
jgi:phosphate transport system substrate-binding protein